ncbi:MAG: cysteine peptidase family C39 domain-containing protein [Planctomycetaceae bacterium]
MSDLILAALILTAVSVGIFLATVWLARRVPRLLCDALAVAVVLLIGYYIRYLWDNMAVARLLPFSSLIVLGNWFPPAIAVLAGLAWNRVPPPATRKAVAVALLFGCAALAVYYPFRGKVPDCENKWNQNVCLQTTRASCSAACAATLLRHHDIEASEQEMAELCITRTGTTWWGLYRGLKLKTAGTELDVDVVSGPAADLPAIARGGVILFVGLTADFIERNPRYRDEGWIAGTSHSVVLFDIRDDGRCLVGDPSSGPEVWPVTDLDVLYQGRGMRLVKRGGSK